MTAPPGFTAVHIVLTGWKRARFAVPSNYFPHLGEPSNMEQTSPKQRNPIVVLEKWRSSGVLHRLRYNEKKDELATEYYDRIYRGWHPCYTNTHIPDFNQVVVLERWTSEWGGEYRLRVAPSGEFRVEYRVGGTWYRSETEEAVYPSVFRRDVWEASFDA